MHLFSADVEKIEKYLMESHNVSMKEMFFNGHRKISALKDSEEKCGRKKIISNFFRINSVKNSVSNMCVPN